MFFHFFIKDLIFVVNIRVNPTFFAKDKNLYENVNRIKRAVQPFLVLDPADLNRLRVVFELPSFDCWPFFQGQPFLAWQVLLTYKKVP